MPVLTIALLLFVVMGVSLGLLGGGGSILSLPILLYLLHVPTKAALATSLLVVASTSLLAMLLHARAGNVFWRVGLLFSGFAMVGAWAAGFVAAWLPSWLLLALFTALMLVTGLAMLRPRSKGDAQEEAKPVQIRLPLVAAEGLLVGAATGLVGAGGGFLVVPALVLLAGLPMIHAIGTSLLVITLKSFAGFAGYAAHVQLDMQLTAAVIAASLVGTVFGVALSRRFDSGRLRKGFAWFVLVMGAFMLYQQAGPMVVDFGLPSSGFAVLLAVGLLGIAWRQRRAMALA